MKIFIAFAALLLVLVFIPASAPAWDDGFPSIKDQIRYNAGWDTPSVSEQIQGKRRPMTDREVLEAERDLAEMRARQAEYDLYDLQMERSRRR